MNSRISLTSGLVLCAVALAACGSGSSSAGRSHASVERRPAASKTTTYLHRLEAVNNLLGTDASTFDECATAYNAPACRQWAQHDRQLVQRSIAQLTSVQTPGRLASVNARVLALLRRFQHDDNALVRDVRSSGASPTTPTAAVLNDASDIATATTSRWFPLLHRLDPSISIPQQ